MRKYIIIIFNSIDYSSANVVVHLEGDLSDVTEYGVIYGTESEKLDKTVSKSGKPLGENTFTLSGLDGVTQYYYRVYAKCGDQEFSSDLYNFKFYFFNMWFNSFLTVFLTSGFFKIFSKSLSFISNTSI